VHIEHGQSTFGGRWGVLYLKSIYHHGHGSFADGGPKLKAQLTWRDKFYRDRVLIGRRYKLSLTESFLVRASWFPGRDSLLNRMKA
jgi:hypothetical protein